MSTNYLAEFDVQDSVVSATIIDRDTYSGTFSGSGDCVCDAVADAFSGPSITFNTEDDERDACVAAMRSMRFTFHITESNRVVSHGFV